MKLLGGLDPETLCEPDDLAIARTLPEIREGDLLAFHNAGAYGASMASNYNSRPRPAEALLRGCEAKLIRRKLSKDLVRDRFALTRAAGSPGLRRKRLAGG